MTGLSVFEAITPGRAAERPAIAMYTFAYCLDVCIELVGIPVGRDDLGVIRHAVLLEDFCYLVRDLRIEADPEITATSAISAIQTYIVLIQIYYEQIHMEKEPLLMLPALPPVRVRFAMSRQAINHRSAEFGAAYADCVRVRGPRLVRQTISL